ncbi:PREDICTED: uncharacterized protein LOC104805598 [Tarenaya hassleriana]|uniref:uncharacterized protein LOC104805598 n=1 Tax=Tarenaya hassleriana TaxID=28532 RepID=UPI00053C479C|nr:PREDICTED: uncharacterized protein LOC104805598 [Tarenaya hassleriana]
MSLEEKSKYTQQAREVWNTYLTAAPSQPPKPKKQTKLVTRCSPGRLLNVIQRLTSEQKEAVKNMGFGGLLDLRCRTLRRSLCLWLLERFDTRKCCLKICGHCIPLHPKDVEHVMGLASDGKEVINSGPGDVISDLRLSYNATNHGISVHNLEEKLLIPEAGEDFKRSFILYALGTLISPTARLDVSPSFLHFLTNIDVIHQFNWGKFLLDRLVREVSRFQQRKQHAVGGCLLFLQLFYYENVSVDGTKAPCPTTIPCLSFWGEDEINQREKREKQLGGYGFGYVVCKEQYVNLPLHENPKHRDDLSADRSVQEFEDVSPIDSGVREPKETSKVIDRFSGSAQTSKRCACPLPECSFIGSSEHLSLHFSSKHWDSGRRFQYNSPLSISLSPTDRFLVLQAEEDGKLFVLNKTVESLGFAVMLTRVEPRLFEERFVYDLTVRGRGYSSLRLKSTAENFPGRVEGFPPLDFLLVPLRFIGDSGEISLEVCIWSSEEHGEASS